MKGPLRKAALVLAVVAIALWLLNLFFPWFTWGLGPRVMFVLPNGFHGTVRIDFDAERGVAPDREFAGYVVRVPADGKLRYRTLDPWVKAHQVEATYTDGSTIEAYPDDRRPVGETDVALWDFGTTRTSEGETFMEWFVGTRAEKREYVSQSERR